MMKRGREDAMTGPQERQLHFETICAAVDLQPASVTRPLVMPIVPAAVFQFDSLEQIDDCYEGRSQGFIYSRSANPNQAALESLLARLEQSEAALACASGMGAITAALLPRLKTRDRVVASEVLYGATMALIAGPLAALGVQPIFVDVTDQAAVARALAQPAAVVIVETISNPLLTIPDIPALAGLAHAAGARLIVDNTFATPYHYRPLLDGADIVVHSGTKFLGGHSDVTVGVLAGSAELMAEARQIMANFGAPASPFDCWLTVRGMKTLALRMERSSANALRVASFLAGCNDTVAAVHYPGLAADAQHGRALALLQRGYGAMVAFELRGGERAASSFVRGLRQIRLAPSLGDVSTTVSHPSKTSHRGMTEEARQAIGIRPGLIRLSAGIEDPDDIIADLRAGLQAAGMSSA